MIVSYLRGMREKHTIDIIQRRKKKAPKNTNIETNILSQKQNLRKTLKRQNSNDGLYSQN